MKAKMKLNRLLSLLIALTMVLGMLPAMSLTAFAAEPGISITGSTSDSSGTGWSYDESSRTLTLNGYNGSYIHASGMTTLNLVLNGTNTITGDFASSGNVSGDYCGIACDTVNLNISGSGSLDINAAANTGTRRTYGIYAYDVTMSGGTVVINAVAGNSSVYGVRSTGSKLEITGGNLTANITGTNEVSYGLYCESGEIAVGSDAVVKVDITNNGSKNMFGIFNKAGAVAGGEGNGDITLAGTVTVTKNPASSGNGSVYGIANENTKSNTDGVISVTGGSVTVTNAYYGIISYTKGHSTAYDDVVISGGTVNVTSTLDGSLGIVSWNNGVTISGGNVTACTANSALWLVDSDSTNKTGLVKITGDAKVSLTSTGYKALMVQGDESTSSTRVHQINLTSGGRLTAKSEDTGVNEINPVQGYFNLGSNTKIKEGSFRTSDGTNAGGGKLFQADSTTKQVVVAYNTSYTGAGAVSVNGHPFTEPTKLYYKNGDSDTTNDSTDYNAHYDPATGVLELKDYNSGPIIIGGSNAYDLTVKLTGTNTVTTSAPREGVGNVCVGINITNADNVTFIGDGTLTVNTNAGSGLTQVFGIWLDRSANVAENLTFQSGKVTVNVTAADIAAQVFGVSTVNSSVGGPITVAEGAELNVTLSSASTGLANGLYSKGDITLNGKTDITQTYTGSGSPSTSNWSSVFSSSGYKINVGANAAITVDMPDAYSLTNGMGSAYYAAKSGSQIGNGDWTNTTASEQYFENDSFLVTQSVVSGYGYADYKYEVITPLTFEDKSDYDIPAGTKGTGYTATVALTATGGSGEYRYEFEGTTPSDLSINAENKLVYTRSSLCDATTAIVKVMDKGGISKSITIDIGAVTEASPGTGTVPPIENKTVTVGTDVFVPWPEGATKFQLYEGSTMVSEGEKSGYPTGMYIRAKSSPTTKTFMFKVRFPGGWVESNEFTVTWTAAAYTVTVQNDGNGSGNATPATAAAGTEITLSASANTGYHFKEWQVVSGSVTITDNKFTMPASDVTVKAIFEADAAGVTKLDKPTNLVWDGTTAKWDAVTGADKYRVILYANDDSGSGGFGLISNTDITTNSKDFSEYMLPGMYYYFEVAAYNSANYSDTFSGFAYSGKKQMPGSIGTVTGFAWSGNTISWTAVEGATGYDVWVMKDGTQKGSVRNISGTSFDLTSDIASDGDATYYVRVSAYKLARGNYLAEGNSPAKIIGTTPAYSATVENVSVNGTIGIAITEIQVVIYLTNDTFVSALSGNWITNLPTGLSQSVRYGGTNMAIITISGTPTASSTEQIAITIPADQLIVNTDGLAVTANANAKFNISAPVTIDTVDVKVTAPVAGANPSFTATPADSEKYTVTVGSWYDGTAGKDLTASDTFTAGHKYYLRVVFTAKSGYTFDSNTEFTINGKSTDSYATVAGYRLITFDVPVASTTHTVSGTATSAGSDTDDVIIQLIEVGTSEAAYETVVHGNTAEYSIAGVASGTYTMKVMKKNHATREYTVTVDADNVTQDVKIHLKGDIDGDGVVKMSDIAKINAHIKETKLLEGYAFACADVDGNGQVKMTDITRVNAHVKEIAPLW